MQCTLWSRSVSSSSPAHRISESQMIMFCLGSSDEKLWLTVMIFLHLNSTLMLCTLWSRSVFPFIPLTHYTSEIHPIVFFLRSGDEKLWLKAMISNTPEPYCDAVYSMISFRLPFTPLAHKVSGVHPIVFLLRSGDEESWLKAMFFYTFELCCDAVCSVISLSSL